MNRTLGEEFFMLIARPPELNIELDQIKGKKPVIVQIVPHLGVGGAEQACVDMASAIQVAGGTAIVISNGGHPTKLQDLKRAGATHINLPVHRKGLFSMWRNIKHLEHILRDKQADLVHVRSRAPAWPTFFAARRLKIPMITTCHAPYNGKGRIKKFYNSIMGSGVRVIAISDFVANYVRTVFKAPEKRIRMIHRCVDLMRFNPDFVTPDRLIRMTERWRAPDGATVILLPGRLTRWKGHRVLIEAIAELKNPDIFVIIQGSDQGRHKYRNELLALIRKLQLDGQIRIVDHDNDVPAMYRAAHIIVSASIDPEGFGRVAIEGMAMGRLVVATNHGGSKETIIDGKTGWLVPPNDAGALARVLTDILALSDQTRAMIGDQAMAHVIQNFSREKFMNETLRVYNEVFSMRTASATN